MTKTRVKPIGSFVSIAALVVIVGACSKSEPSANAREAPASTTSPTTTVPPSASDGTEVIVASANGTSPCEEATPTPLSPGQVGAGTGGSAEDGATKAGHGERGMVRQLPLTHAERVELQAQMEQARVAAATYPTVATALAAGYDKSTPYVPCIGAHYTDVKLAIGFDPARPSELLYDGTDPDSKIVGLSYLVYHRNGPPPGFAGPNDHWHQHNANGGLCLAGGVVVGGENTSAEQCAAAGGRKTLLLDVWMLHAWAVPGFECSWGVFGGECPELGGRLGGTAWETPVAKGDAAG